jgi:Ni,Fe-hydrogenase maturation factor
MFRVGLETGSEKFVLVKKDPDPDPKLWKKMGSRSETSLHTVPILQILTLLKETIHVAFVGMQMRLILIMGFVVKVTTTLSNKILFIPLQHIQVHIPDSIL